MNRFPGIPCGSRPARRGLALFLAGLLATCVLAGSGCESTTEPVPESSPFTFLPAGNAAFAPLGGQLEFQVRGSGLDQVSITWTRGSGDAATGPRYMYRCNELEGDELRVLVADDGQSYERVWQVGVDPAGRDLVVFSPAQEDQAVFVDLPERFGVASDWGDVAATWSLDGVTAGTGPEFVLVPATPGPGTLAVTVALSDTSLVRSWSLDVRPAAEAQPAPIEQLRELPGANRGEISLAWSPPTATFFPVSHYEIRVSADGPVTDANWSDLPALPIVEGPAGAAEIVAAVPGHLTGFEGGETAWCGVRGRNVRDLLAPTVGIVTTVIDGRWWITGTIRDPQGNTLEGVDVSTVARTHATLTTADGTYRIGPFELTKQPTLLATTPLTAPAEDSWYAAFSDPLDADSPPTWDLILLPRYGCDERCTGFDGHFVEYLRNLTQTMYPLHNRPNTRLYRWETYPVPVHVPEFTSANGADYGEACRAMVQAWNDNLEEETLVLVDDPADATVRFVYELDQASFYGRADLDQPGGGRFELGEAIPELVTVRLQPDLPSALAVQAVALHELGHVLGLSGHALCAGPEYLMWVGGINPQERPPAESIHIDEIRAVRLMRRLPQGLDMSAYPIVEY